jgi:hypothetical protein
VPESPHTGKSTAPHWSPNGTQVAVISLLGASGSQTGSQRPQAWGYAGPRPAIITAAQRHVRPHQAMSGDVTGMPPKQ